MAGFFDKMFDFNHDGKLSAFEKGVKWGTIAHFIDESRKSEEDTSTYCGFDNTDYLNSDDIFATVNDVQISDLELAGLDPDDLEFMDEDERRETLENAGLDPDDYDF